jgi:ABC-type nitrate/sulfonate/bicarbonate transport system substrate-binding protein
MKKFSRISLFLALVLICGLFADISTGAETDREDVTLRLADMSVYGIAVFNYAKEIGLLDGYFDDLGKYKINVELSEWPSGVDQNTAFAANQIDFSIMGNLPAVTGVSNGFGTKILAVNYLYDNEYFLVVRKASGVTKISELKGRNVGTYVGTVQHYAVAKYLEGAGLSLDDVNLLNTAAESITALRNGDIDATTLENVVAHRLVAEGTVVTLSENQVPIYNYVVGREAFAKKYPDIAVRVLKLINDTWAYVLEHKPEYTEYYAKVSGEDLEIVKASYGLSFPIKSAKDFDEKDYELYVGFIDWMKGIEYLPSDVKPEDLLDLSYVKQLKK